MLMTKPPTTHTPTHPTGQPEPRPTTSTFKVVTMTSLNFYWLLATTQIGTLLFALDKWL